MDFSSDLSSGSSGDNKMNSGALMEQVKVQIAMANVQELIERVTDKCFKKCIGKPGTSLDNTEQDGNMHLELAICEKTIPCKTPSPQTTAR
uniref:mitochondrial import inner membrane translocase subunit Tim13-like isoform X2 n=1 Tax=Myxine glutinosa TaxID=7769 RepID=UPI00358E63FE